MKNWLTQTLIGEVSKKQNQSCDEFWLSHVGTSDCDKSEQSRCDLSALRS